MRRDADHARQALAVSRLLGPAARGWLLGVLVAASPSEAQPPAPATPPSPPPRAAAEAPDVPAFRTAASVIVIEATIVDRKGVPVPGLGPADVRVELDGKAREIMSMELVQAPAAAVSAELEDVSSNTAQHVGRTLIFVIDEASLSDQSRSVLEAGRRWLKTLAPGDRVGLVALPQPGLRVEPTTAHERVAEALGRVAPSEPVLLTSGQRNVSLFEALQMVDGDTATRTQVLARECGVTSEISCVDEVDVTAQELNSLALARARASVTAVQSLVEALSAVPGPKHVVLVTAGWAVPERFLASVMEPVAAAASASHVLIHGMLAERFALSAAVGRVSPRPSADRELVLSSVELLSDWTGGQSLRVVGQGDGAYAALNGALSGYYRLGVRAEPADLDGKPHRISVKVARQGASVRGHRRLMSAAHRPPTPRDDEAVALRNAVRSPTVSVDFGVRVTSYTLSDGGASGNRFRIFVAGDVSKATPGPARVLAVLFDDSGKAAGTGEQALLVGDDGAAELGGSFPLPQGVYTLRVAVRDAAGRFASVERTVDARFRAVRDLETSGLTLFRASNTLDRPEPVLAGLSTEERLIVQVELQHDEALRPGALPAVLFDVQRDGQDERLLRLTPSLARSGTTVVAQETVPGSVLPAGRYRLVVRTSDGGPPLLTRRFVVEAGPPRRRAVELRAEGRAAAAREEAGLEAEAAAPSASGAGLAAFSALALARPAPFDPRAMLDPAFVAPTIARLASRPDAADVRETLDRLDPASWPSDTVRGPLAGVPVAANLVAGLARMRANDFERAAGDFRAALRAAPDFTPALVYFAACYASGGKDREAASAWQTALLRDRDTPAIYRFAIEAWLRAEGAPAALMLARQARAQWPAEAGMSRLHALAAFAAGEVQEGIQLVTTMGESVDEPLVLMALASLYAAGRDAAPAWNADRDLPVMRALRGRYAARAGRSIALVDAWLADLAAR